MDILQPPTATSRRGFLTQAAALAAVPMVGALGAEAAFATPAAATPARTAALDLPEYAPVPASALGPEINSRGYYVGRVTKNLFYVTDSTYMSAFLVTRDGVVLFDAPPTIGHNLQRAVDDVTRPLGVSNKITHLIYSHHHSDHAGGSAILGKNVTRIGHSETRRLLLRDNDPARPAPEETFKNHRTLHIGGERIDLAWQGNNHTPDNIYIHLPRHDTLILIDVMLPGWVPFADLNVSEDIPGFVAAPAKALQYPWSHFIGGHLGRLGTRRDVAIHQQYMADMDANVRRALNTIDPTPFFARYGDNAWAAVKTYQDALVDEAARPLIAKYTGVLAAADVYTASHVFTLMLSIRIDLGYGSHIHA